jgi:hypothetical protein
MLSRIASVGVGAVVFFFGCFIALHGAGLAGGFVIRRTSQIRPLAGMADKGYGMIAAFDKIFKSF